MTQTFAFRGRAIPGPLSELGEGPGYDPATGRIHWFDILGKVLHEHDPATGESRQTSLPVMASVLAPVDAERQLIATETGLMLRSLRDATLTPFVELEPGKPENRSNDGRLHQSGALWIGTMGKKAQKGAGSLYHVRGRSVTRLFGDLSIPNAICFSPDGRIGYFTDTLVNRILRVALDPATGLPTGEPELFVDTAGQPGGADGAVCDADGFLWNARWGGGVINRYAPDGTLVERHEMPVPQPSCPAFFGPDADRLMVTSAHEGMDADGRRAAPLSGHAFLLDRAVRGQMSPKFDITSA